MTAVIAWPVLAASTSVNSTAELEKTTKASKPGDAVHRV
jgi:hypothetical protein